MVRILSYGFAALLFGAGAAFAETSPADDSGTVQSDATGIEDVSPGNLKIATALFDAQSGETADPPSDGDTASAWSLDDILQAKQDGQGWGQIFKQMKEDGAIDAKNLGQLVSRHNRELNGSLGAEDRGLAHKSNNSDTGDDPGDAVTSIESGNELGSTANGSAEGPEVKVGAYKELSPGGQKIADSLFDGQSIGEEGNHAWSLDQIATAKQDGQGWGEIFKQMKNDGLTDAKNIGQLVSGRHHLKQTANTSATSNNVATKGSSRRSSAGGKATDAGGKQRIGTASRTRRSGGGSAHASSNSSFSSGIVAAGGGPAVADVSVSTSSGSGNSSGLGKALGRGK